MHKTARFKQENMLIRHLFSMLYIVEMHWKPVCVQKNELKTASFGKENIYTVKKHILSIFYTVGIHWKPVWVGGKV